MRVQSHNYNNVQGWMVTELKLFGGELLIYSAIYGFTQEQNQWYTGARQYLADWTGCTKQTVTKYLKSLVEKGLIIRRERAENGVIFVDYRANISPTVAEKITGVGENFTHGSKNNHLGVGENFNTIINSNSNNTKTSNKSNICKHRYGEYNNVLLTDEEYQKLRKEVPDYEEWIQKCSEYVASTGRSYKSHYAAIRKWVRKEEKEKIKPSKRSREFTSELAQIASWAERSEGHDQTGIW